MSEVKKTLVSFTGTPVFINELVPDDMVIGGDAEGSPLPMDTKREDWISFLVNEGTFEKIRLEFSDE